MDTRAAAALLGAKLSEVAAVDESDGAAVITTTAGVRYVVLAEDAPDAEGKTGLMLLAAPSDGPVSTIDGITRWNSFPLHVPHPDPTSDGEEVPGEEVPAEVAPRPKPRKAK